MTAQTDTPPSHRPPSSRPHLAWSLSITLGLGACGSTVRLDTPPQPSPAPAATPTAAATASAAPSAATPPHGEQDRVQDSAQASAIAPPNVEAQSLDDTVPADSYAGRSDAAALATELAQNLGLPRDWVWSALSQARFQESVPRLMMPPPTPTAKNWAAYRARFIEPTRIQAGAQFWRTYQDQLTRAEDTYGVPAHIIVGVLGVETQYGRNMGRYRVLDALTTLTLDFPRGRSDRSAFFKSELGAYLLMCREQGLDATQVTGSFAGAIGWPQFMPSSIRKLAVDFDGDGHIDLIHNPIDAIGSVARYLAEHGWQKGQATYFGVTPPEPSEALDTLLAPDIVPSFSAAEMASKGATLSAAGQRHPGLLALVQLYNGGQPPSFVAGTVNFYAITRYNQSSYYALAVAQLGEAISREVLRQNGRTPTGR
ncbi:MAG: lytic murein transglycosylase B [Proteobacteria bacterium]|uniref:lytic murein transglycosylase B n=1 Tax=Aquabacterium sp. TaxID=1872578 RepID=UPI0035C78843|nr:lytic murein transglycosylase B [Pseudomonadota bacterium]